MNFNNRFLLSLMMFLQYFIWGAWYVTMGTYMGQHLGSTGVQIGAAYSALAIATMISPFFVGLIADRFFAAQNLMGVLHLVGAALLFLATKITDNTIFYWVILVYSLIIYANDRIVKQCSVHSNERSRQTISVDPCIWHARLDRSRGTYR